MTEPFSETWFFIYSFVGLIFNRSVHQRIVWFGLGYPFPISNTQKVFSSSGVVRAKVTGSARLVAASSICFVTSFKCEITKGLSTMVSLDTICTALFLFEGGVLSKVSKTACTTNVLSFPPEKPIIQGEFCSSLRYSCFTSLSTLPQTWSTGMLSKSSALMLQLFNFKPHIY